MKSLTVPVLVLMVLFSGVARAEDSRITVAPAIDFAFKRSLFKLNGATGYFVEPSYTTFVPSLAISAGKFYAVVSYDTPMAPWEETSLNLANDTLMQTSFTRSESVITVGYRLPWSLNVFGGYLHGESTQTETWYIADAVLGHVVWPTTYSFDERGIFLGINWSRSFGDRGTLSVSVASGIMDGTFTVKDYNGTTDPTLFVASDSVYKSHSPGFSLNVGWTGTITGNMVYRTGLKYTKYVFDTDTLTVSDGTGTTSGPSDTSLTEEVFSLSFGIANYF